MASKKKLLQAAAGSAGGAGLDVDEVFSTYLYDGNSGTQSIINGIDLSGEGGLVWIKRRDGTLNHALFDTERGAGALLQSNLSAGHYTGGDDLTAFNSNGFTLGDGQFTTINYSSYNYASWTFRKAPKFFDVLTYTGNGTAGRTVSHNLGSVPGMIIFKKTSAADGWAVYHRGANGGTDPEDYRLELNENFAQSNRDGFLNDTAPTATHFTVGDGALSNTNGQTYVAYLFAHNDGDGKFGDGTQDIIKCGSYTGNGSTTGPTVDLGFEPQWVMLKRTDSADEWFMYDVMRGFDYSTTARLSADSSSAESPSLSVVPTSTGFQPVISHGSVNASGGNYIYMAIRRGPLAAPTDATKVFALDDSSTTDIGGYTLNSNFPVDFYFFKNKNGGDSISIPRLTVGDLRFNSSAAEEDRSSVMNFDSNTGVTRTSFQGGIDSVDYAFRRAPNFFDVVTYTGTGSARTVAHNLGVAPEMMWMKCRSDTEAWAVYHNNIDSSAPEDYGIYLNDTAQRVDSANFWNDTAPTSSVFTVGTAGKTNGNTQTYIAYLFATAAGVSKVGSFSHTNGGGDTNVDCGFSSGARLVIYKRTDDTGSWYIFDSVRGIVSGSGDAQLELNSTGAENTGFDLIDPYSSGFKIPSNATGTGNYIFYAIA